MVEPVTAAILVIGDEILSGRTKDKNIGTIADHLSAMGIDLSEVRIVPDVEAEIVAAVNALRARYTYLFTTGGIGPTHDDITADSVAKAFGVGIAEHPEAIRMLLERIRPEDLNEARRRMARIPDGAELIRNDVSKAPGFMIGNVIVMAGVPAIMREHARQRGAQPRRAATAWWPNRSTPRACPRGPMRPGSARSPRRIPACRSGPTRPSRRKASATRSWCGARTPTSSRPPAAAVVTLLAGLKGDGVPA